MPDLVIVTTERNVIEIETHVPEFATRYKLDAVALRRAIEALPVDVHREPDYASRIAEAERLLGQTNSGDVHLLALAIALNVPIWSNDNDFTDDLPVAVFRTAQLIKLLGV